jgi:hypothetical protein
MDVVSIVDALYRPLQQMLILAALYDYGINIKTSVKCLLLFRRDGKDFCAPPKNHDNNLV